MDIKIKPIEVEMRPNGLDMDIDKQSFALALKTWRLRNGLSQVEAGKRFGCSRYTIMRAESARNITWEQAYRMFAKLADELRKEGSPW